MSIGPRSPNAQCAEEYKLMQKVIALESQLATVTAERDALQESNRQESAAMALLLERECKDGDRLAEALGVPRTEGGSLQVLRMLNAIDALRVDAESDVAMLRAALVGLIGADSEQELRQMEATMRLLPAPEADKAVSINAIHALLATKTPNVDVTGASGAFAAKRPS